MPNCSVVDRYACKSPANSDAPNVRTKCYVCGDFVCTECSALRTMTFFTYPDGGIIPHTQIRRVRVCNTCHEANQ